MVGRRLCTSLWHSFSRSFTSDSFLSCGGHFPPCLYYHLHCLSSRAPVLCGEWRPGLAGPCLPQGCGFGRGVAGHGAGSAPAARSVASTRHRTARRLRRLAGSALIDALGAASMTSWLHALPPLPSMPGGAREGRRAVEGEFRPGGSSEQGAHPACLHFPNSGRVPLRWS